MDRMLGVASLLVMNRRPVSRPGRLEHCGDRIAGRDGDGVHGHDPGDLQRPRASGARGRQRVTDRAPSSGWTLHHRLGQRYALTRSCSVCSSRRCSCRRSAWYDLLSWTGAGHRGQPDHLLRVHPADPSGHAAAGDDQRSRHGQLAFVVLRQGRVPAASFALSILFIGLGSSAMPRRLDLR